MNNNQKIILANFGKVQNEPPILHKENFSFQNKITTINFLTENLEETIKSNNNPIIVTNVPGKIGMIKGLFFGADAVTHIDISSEEWTLTYQALQQKCFLVDRGENPHFLIDCSNTIQKEVYFQQCCVAISLINYWRLGDKERILQPNFYHFLYCDNNKKGLDRLIDLILLKPEQKYSYLVELDRLLENFSGKIKKNKDTIISRAQNLTAKWFSQNYTSRKGQEITSVYDNLIENYLNLKDIIFSSFLNDCNQIHIGSYNYLQIVLERMKQIKQIRQQYQIAKNDHQQKAEEANDAQSNLISSNIEENYTYIINAIRSQYQHKIYFESLSLANILLAEVDKLLATIKQSLIITDNFLYEIQFGLQKSLQEEDVTNILLDLSNYHSLLSQLNHNLITKFGNFAEWGNISQSDREQIKAEILNQSLKIALETVATKYFT